MIIKNAVLNDLEDIRKLNQELFYHEANFDKTLDLEWPSKNDKYYRSRILGRNSVALIVEIEKKVVGYLIGTITKCEDYRKIMKIAELESMFIDEKYRGLGIGSKLIKEFSAWAKTKKANRLKVNSTWQNKRAINVYKKNFFFEYNVVLEANI